MTGVVFPGSVVRSVVRFRARSLLDWSKVASRCSCMRRARTGPGRRRDADRPVRVCHDPARPLGPIRAPLVRLRRARVSLDGKGRRRAALARAGGATEQRQHVRHDRHVPGPVIGMTMTLSPAGRMYLLQHQAHAVRVATAKCPRCGDLLYADARRRRPASARRRS